eukprot:jgi/Chrpa1/1445/Chrysochromulina_OHIO_Genome00008835-RA
MKAAHSLTYSPCACRPCGSQHTAASSRTAWESDATCPALATRWSTSSALAATVAEADERHACNRLVSSASTCAAVSSSPASRTIVSTCFSFGGSGSSVVAL